ncbi:helix-turn-helix domain-containing protein [Celerinatantimonas sp. YJH-8]|uniref:helix-turn-helix domain-containing protein n=1 Tax=Celerinatantimonas sp. YJH-8 TaxID=3228714 RepID=UPI0038BFA0F5
MLTTQLSCSSFFPENNGVDILARAPQPEFPVHSHEFYELVLVLSGSAIHIVDGIASPIARGSIFYLSRSELEHCYVNMDNLCLTNVLLNPEQFKDNSLCDILDHSFVPNQGQFFINDETIHYCHKLLQLIKEENVHHDQYGNYMITNLLNQLAITLWRNTHNSELLDADVNKILLIVKYIHENYNCSINWPELSDKYNISFKTLTRKMKSLMGITPNSYLNRVRLCQSSRLLKDKKIPVTQVAFECGFNDSNYFSYKFHELFGTTPIKYRHQFFDI